MSQPTLSFSPYRDCLGDEFADMPPALQHFHAAPGDFMVHGHIKVKSGSNTPARLVAWLMGAPISDVEGPFHLERTIQGGCEVWTRRFPDACFRSTIHTKERLLIESMGPFSASSRVVWASPHLKLELVGVTLFGLPVPSFLLPRLIAEEWADGTRLCFNIDTHAPFVGRLFAYSGHLEIVT